MNPDIALQKIVATAVKRSATEVTLSCSDEEGTHRSVMVTFKMPDGTQASIKLKSEFVKTVSMLIESSVLLERSGTSFSTIGSYRLESEAVNFKVNIDINQDNVYQTELKLSGFRVNSADDPLFWLDLDNLASDGLKSVFKQESGIIFLSSTEEKDRIFAKKSLVKSYANLKVVDLSSSFLLNDNLLSRAESELLLVCTGHDDIFSAVRSSQTLEKDKRGLVRGFVSFRRFSRLCPLCLERQESTSRLLRALPDYLRGLEVDFFNGKGCIFCSQSGYLGQAGVISTLKLVGELEDAYVDGISDQEFWNMVADSSFVSLFENGLRHVAKGKTSLAQLVAHCPQTAESFEFAREQNASQISISAGAEESKSLSGYLDMLGDSDLSVGDQAAVGDFLRSKISTTQGGEDSLFPAIESESRRERFLFTSDSVTTVQPGQEKPKVEVEEEEEEKPVILDYSRDTERELLIVEDDVDQQAILRAVFERAGFRVSVQGDGKSGLNHAIESPPDIILIDFMMPDMDGYQAVKKLRSNEKTKNVPVVVLTAYADSEVECNFLEAGANDFCSKSISKQVLLTRVEKLLDK